MLVLSSTIALHYYSCCTDSTSVPEIINTPLIRVFWNVFKFISDLAAALVLWVELSFDSRE
jgi:hypothetical protein